MTQQEIIQDLIQQAKRSPYPHVQRIAHMNLIEICLDGMTQAGWRWERIYSRIIKIDGGNLRGKYLHPHKAPLRHGGGLVLCRMWNRSDDEIVHTVKTREEAIDFANFITSNPQSLAFFLGRRV